MARRTVYVAERQCDDDSAHYHARTALEEVLAWFVEDGYDRADLLELCEEALDNVFDEDET